MLRAAPKPGALPVANDAEPRIRRRGAPRRSSAVASVETSSIRIAVHVLQRLPPQRVERFAGVRRDVVPGHDDGDRGGGASPARLYGGDGCRDRVGDGVQRLASSACGNVKRTAVCATSGGTPIASSTCEGSSLPAAHADPLEETTPRRSSSSSTASPLVPGEGEARRPGQPVHRVAGQARGRHGVEHAGDEPSRSRVDAGGCTRRAPPRPARARSRSRPRRRRPRCRCGARAPGRRRAEAARGARGHGPRARRCPSGAPSLCPASEIASTPRAAALSGSHPAACTASTCTGHARSARDGCGDRGDILDRADLVVRVADASRARCRRAARRRDGRRIDAPELVHRHARHVEAVHPARGSRRTRGSTRARSAS